MKPRLLTFLSTLALPLILSNACLAESFTGTVVRVIDGDTVVVNPVNPGDPVKKDSSVRLAEIDAPELEQAHGKKSKDALSNLVLHETVRIEYSGKDFFGRIIGTIYLSGDRNINAALISKGHAWWYERYSENEALGKLQDSAKAQELGLWQGNKVIAPWMFRRGS